MCKIQGPVWHCKGLPEVTDMRCEEMDGGLAKEKAEREGGPLWLTFYKGRETLQEKTRQER